MPQGRPEQAKRRRRQVSAVGSGGPADGFGGVGTLYIVANGLTYGDIEQATGIPHADLKRCLQSLACVKSKNVLRKEPMSKIYLKMTLTTMTSPQASWSRCGIQSGVPFAAVSFRMGNSSSDNATVAAHVGDRRGPPRAAARRQGVRRHGEALRHLAELCRDEYPGWGVSGRARLRPAAAASGGQTRPQAGELATTSGVEWGGGGSERARGRQSREAAAAGAPHGAVALEPEAAEVEVEVEATTPTSPSEPSTHALVTPMRRTARARSRAAAPPGTHRFFSSLFFSFSSLFSLHSLPAAGKAAMGEHGCGRRATAERPTPLPPPSLSPAASCRPPPNAYESYGLAARVLATLYAGARALDGAFFLASPGPDRCLQPPTPLLRLLRPRAAARCHSPSAVALARRLPLLQPRSPTDAAPPPAPAAARPEAKRSPRCAHAEREEKKEKRLGCN
ncbi:hypothetical protein [Oryza sativa Japonica Group]|uniref:Cullin-like alpha+beta domain-containing protein n=1 Tax=Oryza sativa subsp. japonica TaxID=39947 RepID=Q8S9R0_ORYSJ|nr:hypothetical protein [Oryza sativa Japonica Group]